MNWPQLIGTIVLICYCSYLGGFSLELEPNYAAVAFEVDDGFILWTVPEEEKSNNNGPLDVTTIPMKETGIIENKENGPPLQNLKQAKMEVFIEQREQPWYIVLPAFAIGAAIEVIIMLACVKIKNKIREEMTLQTYQQSHGKAVKSKSGKKKGGTKSKQKK